MKKTRFRILIMAGMLVFLMSSIITASEPVIYGFNPNEKTISRAEKPFDLEGFSRQDLGILTPTITISHYLRGGWYVFAIPDSMKFEVALGEAVYIYRFATWDNQEDFPNEPLFPWVREKSDISVVRGLLAFNFSEYQDSAMAIIRLKGTSEPSHGFSFLFFCISRDKFVAYCLGNQTVISQLPEERQNLFFAIGYPPYLSKVSGGQPFSMEGAKWSDPEGGGVYNLKILQVVTPNNVGILEAVVYPEQARNATAIINDGQAFGIIFEGVPYFE